MTINEYQKEALKTASGMSHKNALDKLMNGVLGLTGESGEVADILKKHCYQGHALEVEHIAIELGDIAWYIAFTANVLGYDFETILQMNVDKLRKRYPDGFSAERSIHREEEQ
nr:nucleoside triphosphate pyrophosphohydrolase family protein [uncultured Oribacterium sp.]